MRRLGDEPEEKPRALALGTNGVGATPTLRRLGNEPGGKPRALARGAHGVGATPTLRRLGDAPGGKTTSAGARGSAPLFAGLLDPFSSSIFGVCGERTIELDAVTWP